MFPQNDEEMGRALNNLAVELVRRKKIHEEKRRRFLEYWYSSPRYLEMKAARQYNRKYYDDESNARRNAWFAWLKTEAEVERDSRV